QQTRELFDNATAFAPNYYHFYREYANYLLPKWYGEEGEMQRFAEQASAHLPDPEGSIVYFELGSMLACQCDNARDSLDQMSWLRIRQGYQSLVSVYGSSKLKANRFAYMSYWQTTRLLPRKSSNSSETIGNRLSGGPTTTIRSRRNGRSANSSL